VLTGKLLMWTSAIAIAHQYACSFRFWAMIGLNYDCLAAPPEDEQEFESYFLAGFYPDIAGERGGRIYFGGGSLAARCHLYDAGLEIWSIPDVSWPYQSVRHSLSFYSVSEIDSRS